MPTNEEYTNISSPTSTSEKHHKVETQINSGNPFAQQDYSLITNAFEKSSADWAEEDYAIASHYKDVYSTRNFSERVKEQMAYYPGLHQPSTGVPEEDPYKTAAQRQADKRLDYWDNAMSSPESFMNGLRSRDQDFDYRSVFGSDVSAKDRAEAAGKLLTECIPCFGRLLDPGNLVPDGDLLEVHALNINLRLDLMQDLVKLLKDPGAYIDICELINLLSSMCPQDLFAILALLTQYLAKLNLDIKFNIDFIINLVGAILSPFLDALGQWLDKWIQLIIEPLVCVVDHINEVIITSQTMKIPLSSAGVGIDASLGAQTGVFNEQDFSVETRHGYEGTKAAWSEGEAKRYEELPPGHYIPSRPKVPEEELEMTLTEARESWIPSMSAAEREATNEKWKQINQQRKAERIETASNINKQRRDGSRWSKDNTPNSEKYNNSYQFGDEYHPPEEQSLPKQADKYMDLSAVTNSIVQMRNILQGGIQYIRDWFTYITQMIYDLLGTDFGWMKNKTGSSFIKTNLIKLIALVKAIIQAVSKNGLKCGVNSNLDTDQVRFILEDTLNKYSPTQFKVMDNGDIEITPPGRDLPDAKDFSRMASEELEKATKIDTGEGIGEVSDQKASEVMQDTVESGIIVKNCLKDLTSEEATRAREWILEYERRSNG
jgi:hypothetical protein